MPNENSGLLIEKYKTESFLIPRENSAHIEKDKNEFCSHPNRQLCIVRSKRYTEPFPMSTKHCYLENDSTELFNTENASLFSNTLIEVVFKSFT